MRRDNMLSLAGHAAGDALSFVRHTFRDAKNAADDVATAALGSDFEDRLKRVHIATGAHTVDPFGLDPAWAKYALGTAAAFYKFYFRAESFDVNRVPPGRVLLVSNHSGQLPFDGMMIAASIFLEAEPPRIMRSMVEKWTQTLPFVSTTYARLGQVVGVPENARRLLDQGEAILVFPEGTKGISKSFANRYQLADFGLGFLRLALETRTPIVPIAVVGAEEQYISFGNLPKLAKLFHMPSFPLVPQFMIPGLQMPLPVKYRIYYGEPMLFDGDPDDDDAVIVEKVESVRAEIRSMIARGLRERKGYFR
ncbi:MAG: acyltransferase family protein [Polyangiaceae bacterium]|nr:acyltransferase family protein [Polyangiaceae bacterium]